MGSTKHIRNNGEHLNIHGHDNYQMPGAYKQMGDMNQNQSLGAYKLVGDQAELDKNGNGEIDGGDFKMMQPGKISGGASKYIKEAYGVNKIGDPPAGDPKTDPLVENPKKKNTLPSYTETSYKGSTTSKGGDSSSSTSSTASNSGSSTSNYDAVVASEGTKIVDPSKITPEMTAAANAKRAAARAKDDSANASSNSQNSSLTSQNNESSTKTVTLGNQTRAQIEKSGQTQMSNRIKKIAAQKEAALSKAAIDSTKASNQEYDRLLSFRAGGKALQDQRHHDATARKANLRARGSMSSSGLFTREEIDKNFTSGIGSDRNPGISGNVGRASDFGGPNKGIHSSKSKGINKILKQYK
jgi:hypothetical protein